MPLVETHVRGAVGFDAGGFALISLGILVVLALGSAWALVYGARTLVGIGRIQLLPALMGRWIDQRLRSRPPVTEGSGLFHGQRVHLKGVVEADGLSRAPLSGVSTVVCGHAFGESGGPVLGEGLSARDFLVRLDDGTPVRVWAQEAADRRQLRLVDARPHRWNGQRSVGGWFRESRVAPSDQIEIVGVMEMRVDRDAPRIGDRQAPICWTVTAAKGKLLLRFGTRQPEIEDPEAVAALPSA